MTGRGNGRRGAGDRTDRQLTEDVLEARARAFDESRPEAVAAAHGSRRLTARERVAALLDEGSFVEYGVLADSRPSGPGAPADGLVGGTGRVHGAPIVVASYDVTVEEGTQSTINQAKIERLVFLAVEHAWPLVCFADSHGIRSAGDRGGTGLWLGGSGRIGLFDGLCELSGLAPTVAVVSGTSLDGAAAIVMLSEFVVATAGSEIGTSEARMPVEEHARMGDIDVVVDDEASAIACAREYLSHFVSEPESGKPSATAGAIGDVIPENRRRPYDMRKVIDALADENSVLELRPDWGDSMITALIRLDGRTVGLFANQPRSRLVGAIDAAAADKMSRFIELCDAYGFPLLSLIDSPGFHIGPEAERGGIARHHVRTLSAIEHRDVPLYCVQIRKAYGLGPLVMRGSWGHLPPDLRIAWPTVETGGMSLEGAAYLAKRKEILAAASPEEALRIRDEYAETLRARESGVRAGQNFSFDDIVLPEETRDRIISLLRMSPRLKRVAKKTYVDTI